MEMQHIAEGSYWGKSKLKRVCITLNSYYLINQLYFLRSWASFYTDYTHIAGTIYLGILHRPWLILGTQTMFGEFMNKLSNISHYERLTTSQGWRKQSWEYFKEQESLKWCRKKKINSWHKPKKIKIRNIKEVDSMVLESFITVFKDSTFNSMARKLLLSEKEVTVFMILKILEKDRRKQHHPRQSLQNIKFPWYYLLKFQSELVSNLPIGFKLSISPFHLLWNHLSFSL